MSEKSERHRSRRRNPRVSSGENSSLLSSHCLLPTDNEGREECIEALFDRHHEGGIGIDNTETNAIDDINIPADCEEEEEVVEEEDEEVEKDEDKEDRDVDPPEGYIRMRPSKFCNIPGTVFVEYPSSLNMKRNDINVLEDSTEKFLFYQSQWARNCIKNAFTRAGFQEGAMNWTVTWAKHQAPCKLRSLNCLQKVNHFPGSWALGRKDRLCRTILSMKRKNPTEYSFHPESFVLPNDVHCLERCAKADIFQNKSSSVSCRAKKLWVTKPVASSCGRGVKVMTAEKILSLCKKNDKKMIVQRYLSNPYLINRKKFDLRLYVLVTGVDPLRVYLHEEGLVRIATENFTLKNLKNPYVHLTNYSINKKSNRFCASSRFHFPNEGSKIASTEDSSNTESCKDSYKWTLREFKKWLAEKESVAVMEKAMKNIELLIVKTLLAAEPDLCHSLHFSANYRTNCFELFGFDVFLDKQLVPHLLEVNLSPSLSGTSPLDNYIKGVLVADVCHVTGFHPHDDSFLEKYPLAVSDISNNSSQHTRPSSAGRVRTSFSHCMSDKNNTNGNCINPFSFASLYKLMVGQDCWRKDMSVMNIDLEKFGDDDAAWYTLLMIEDEFDRAKSSRFRCLHPQPSSVEKILPLYKITRFSDHLLGKWILEGLSEGHTGRRLLPSKFTRRRRSCHDIDDDVIPGICKGNDSEGELCSPRGSGVALARARGRLSARCQKLHRTTSSSGERMSHEISKCELIDVVFSRDDEVKIRAKSADSSCRRHSSQEKRHQVKVSIGKEVRVTSRMPSSSTQYGNLKNNLRQQNTSLHDPVLRRKKRPIQVSNTHPVHTLVFEPSTKPVPKGFKGNSKSSKKGDIYKHLLYRNMQSALKSSNNSKHVQGYFDSLLRGSRKNLNT